LKEAMPAPKGMPQTSDRGGLNGKLFLNKCFCKAFCLQKGFMIPIFDVHSDG